MPHAYAQIAFTPAVRRLQQELGSREQYVFLDALEDANSSFTEREAAFIESRDTLYQATVSETGWPYVQHRGGPPGFLKVLDETTLAFVDYAGNRQYISTGNLDANDRVALILVDYPRRARLKILAHAQRLALDAEPDLLARVAVPGYRARPERIFRLRLAAFDWNCPQHIVPRFTEPEIARAVAPLREQVAALEAENQRLRERLGPQ